MPDLVAAVASLHAWAAVAAGVLLAAIVVVAALDQVRAVDGRRLADRLILGLIAATLLAALAGPVLALGDRPLEPIHVLYAAVAVGAVPLSRFAAARRGSVGTNAWLIAGSLVTLAVLLRLWATGG